MGRIVVPLIPVIGFAGPPTLDGPTPGRTTLVPLIVPRLSVEGLTFGLAFDGWCPSGPPGLATPPLVFSPKPVGAPAGLLPRGCSALPCSMLPGRATGMPIASRETRPRLSCADRRGRKMCGAIGRILPSLNSCRLPSRRDCTMRVSIASESLPPGTEGLTSRPAALPLSAPSPVTVLLSSLPSGFADGVEPPPVPGASSARQACIANTPISAITRRWTTILKPLLLGVIPPVPRRMPRRTAHDRPHSEIMSAAPERPPKG